MEDGGSENGRTLVLMSHGAGPYGAERMLLAVASALRDEGHTVILDFPHEGPAVDAARALAGVDVAVARRPRLPRSAGEALLYFARQPAAVARTRRRLRSLAPDLVWVNSLYALPVVIAARAAGLSVVWQLHERNLPGPPGWLLSAAVARLPRLVVVVSDFVRRSFRLSSTSPRVRVLPNPRPESVRSVPIEADRSGTAFTVACVGQLEPRKNVEDAVDAVARLPGTRLLIVGDGKHRRQVERAVRESGARERILMLGYRDDVAEILRTSDCVVIPSRNEPFGLIALEALEAGRPVVAARSGALPEVLDDAALFHPAGDVAALATAIDRLREEPDLVEELRRRGERVLSRHDRGPWEREVAAITRAALSP